MRKFYKRGIALLIGATLLVSNNVTTVMATELPDSVTEALTESIGDISSEITSEIGVSETSAESKGTAGSGSQSSDAVLSDSQAAESEIPADNPYGTEEGDGTGEAYSDLSSAAYSGYSTDYPNTWTNTGNQAEDITQIALTQVGYTETDNNHTKYAAWWCGSDTAYAWCGIFISWCANQADIPTTIIKKNGVASGYNVSNMSSNSFGCPAYAFDSTSAKKGDIIYVDSTGNGQSNHVGLVYAVDSTYIYTVEGNYNEKVSLVKYQVSTGYRQLSSYTSTTAHILFYARPSYNGSASAAGTTAKTTAGETTSAQQSSGRTQAAETAETEVSLGTYTITASSLNVRSGPGTSYSKLGVLSKDTVVEIFEISNGWGRIQYAGDSGWISMSYCAEVTADTAKNTEASSESTKSSQSAQSTQSTQTTQSSQTTQSTETSVTYPVYKTSQALNVRSGPGTSYSAIGTIASGTKVTILEKSSSWGRFDYKSQEGWIYLGYCTQTGTVTVTVEAASESQTSESQTTQASETKTTESQTTQASETKTTESQTTQASETKTTESQTAQSSETKTTESQTAQASESQTTQTAESTDYETGTYQVNTSLNVRSGPGTSYSKLGVLSVGTEIKVTETNGRWGKFDYNGTEGWTSLAYCTKVADPVAELKITRQPQSVVVDKEGDTATISIEASGTGLNYCWYYKNPAASAFNASTVNSSTYSLNIISSRNGRQMYCVVTDEAGNSVTSDTVTMSYKEPAAITKQPENVQVENVGDYASVSVEASGDGLTYAWYYKNPGAAAFSKSTVDTSTYGLNIINSRNGRLMYCVVTDQYGNTATTDIVSMSVKGTFRIVLQPEDAVVAQEGDTAEISVYAVGDGLTYTWYYKNASASSFVKSSDTTNTYNYAVTAARNGRQVYCVITDENGNQLTSNTVTMSIQQ